MRIEILVIAALAGLASAAPQWPYRDAVAPYYYGYPGKTPYIYASGDEDDEREESTSMARQDLKVATSDGASTVLVEDDEKADGVRVVETGSAKPLKPVVQSAANNQPQPEQDQQQQQPASASSAQAQQPLSSAGNNANNAPASGQPLTVQQQSGQQPPAFPPARPPKPQQPVAEDDDDEEEDDESEEDDEDAEDEEDDGDDDDEDEEDDEERRRDAIAQKEASSEEPQQVVAQEEEQSGVVAQGSDEVVVAHEVKQPAAEQAHPVPSQTALLNNKINKSKQQAVAPSAVAAVPAAVPAKNKVKKPVVSKSKPGSGAIEALVPGYVTDQGEVLVPVDTVTGSQPITIVPDPFSPPSRIVSGPRPIPQSAVPSVPSRQLPYWYRSSPAINPLIDDAPPSMTRQTLYTDVPPPGSIFTFDDDDDEDSDESVAPGNRLRQDDDGDDESAEEEDDRKKQAPAPPKKQPLAAVPAVGNSNEDDEAEALAFINSGKPVANKKPASANAATGIKKPGGGKPTEPGSNESDSEEDQQSEEDDIDSEEEDEEEEDDLAVANEAANPLDRGRNYVDEEMVSFPPSRTPALFAVVSGKIQGFGGPPSRRSQSQPQVFSVPNPGNPNQRYVVRVTPSNNRPSPGSPLYYRPIEGGSPNKRVVNVASFDVSVEDTRPAPSSYESEEEDSVSIGGPTPVNSYPFVYKVQGSYQGPRGPGPQSLAGLLGRPPRPSVAYYGAAFSSGPVPRPSRPSSYGYGLRPPYSSASAFFSPYGPGGPPSSFSFGPRRPSSGPPVIVRKKPSGGGPIRPPKPSFFAVYNTAGQGPSSGPREPVDEEYYTFEVPEHNNKIVTSHHGPQKKRPTVHRKPTPVIHQKHASEDEDNSDEQAPVASDGPPQSVQIIPHGTVRRRIRGGKQLKPKKNSKKSSTTSKKQTSQDQQDPLGLLSKVNKSKTKSH